MTDEPAPSPADHEVPEVGATGSERPSRRRLWIIGGSVVGAVALLTAAGVVVAAAMSGGEVPMPTPSASQTPSASAGPVREPLVAPVGLDVPCERLLPGSLVSSIMAPDVSLLQDSGETAWSLPAATLRAVGGVDCRWSNEVGPSTGAQEELEVQVIPGAAAAYWNQRSQIVDTQYTRFDLAGDQSDQNCGVWGTDFYCGADVLAGEFWIHLDVYHSGTDAVTEDGVHAAIASLLSAAASGVRGAEGSGLKAPQWLASSGDLCSLAATATGTPLTPVTNDVGYLNPWTEAEDRLDVIICKVQESSNLGFVIYPGLAWAWADILAGGQNMADLEPVDLVGADDAVSGPSWDGTATYVSVGGAIVTTWEEGTTAPSSAAAQLAAAYAAAHGPDAPTP